MARIEGSVPAEANARVAAASRLARLRAASTRSWGEGDMVKGSVMRSVLRLR